MCGVGKAVRTETFQKREWIATLEVGLGSLRPENIEIGKTGAISVVHPGFTEENYTTI